MVKLGQTIAALADVVRKSLKLMLARRTRKAQTANGKARISSNDERGWYQ
jgi:hypothetical protein